MVVFLTIAIGISVLMGLAVPLGIFAGYRFVRLRSDSFATAALIWLIGMGSLLAVATANRNWNASELIGGYYSLTQASVWVSRLFNLAAVGLAVIEILQRVAAPVAPRERGATAIWVAFVFFFVSWILSAVVGTKPSFQHSSLYSFLLLTAVYLQPAIAVEEVIRSAKYVVAVMLYLSLAAIAVQPDLVMQHGYRSLIPGIDFRLHGLTTHANTLGPLSIIYLLLEYWLPSRRTWRGSNSLVAAAVLLLAQSKTAWIAAITAGLVLYFFHVKKTFSSADRRKGGSGQLALAAAPLVIAPMLALGAMLFFQPPARIGQFLEERVPGLATLSGRNLIWEITLNEWRANPVFGYGPSLWDIDFRVSHGLLAVGQAHNQFVQTLGESGILGLTSLIAYMLILLFYAMRHAQASMGVTLALAVVLFIRCVTEAPFRLVLFLEPAFLTHLILFAVLVMLERQRVLSARLLQRPA